MGVIPKVRRNTQINSGGAGSFTPARFTGQAALGAVSNIAGDIAGDALGREEARARNKLDLDFMRAASAYETGLGSIQMPEGGEGYTGLAESAFQGAFGELTQNVPDYLKDEYDGRIESLKIRLGDAAANRAEEEAQSFSRFNLQQGLEMITGEAARDPSAAERLNQRGLEMIQNNPDLSPAERRVMADALTEGLTETAETRRVQTDPLARAAYTGNMVGGPWSTPQEYPYLALAQVTSRSETGTTDVYVGNSVIATDTNGSKSYGIFGINSQGTMQQFVAANPDLGLTADPGTSEFNNQWRAAVQANPDLMLQRQFRWHEENVVEPAAQSIAGAGLPDISRDPRALAFVGDMIVQYGPRGVQKHLRAASGAGNVEEMIGMASESMRNSLDTDFRTYLSQNPSNRAGLLNRISKRENDSLGLTGVNTNLSAGSFNRVRAAAGDVMKQEQDRISAQNDITSAQLGVSVTKGQASQLDIDEALNNRVITPSRWESLSEQLFKAQEAERNASANRSSFQERLNLGDVGNPYDKDDRKAVNEMDEALERSLIENDQVELLPEARLQQLSATGVATEGHIADMRQGISTGNVDMFREIDRALQVAPRGFDGVPGGSDVLTAAKDFKAATRAGMTAENAARFADPNSEDRERADMTTINKEIAELEGESVLAKFDSFLPGDALSATPMMEQAILRDYRVQYEAARLRGLDPETAQERAISDLTAPFSGIYGRSALASGSLGERSAASAIARGPVLGALSEGGEVFDASAGVVRHPPENYYPPIDGNHDYLADDIEQSLRDLDGFGGEWFLMPDPVETDAAIKRQDRGEAIYPGYRVYYTDKQTGALEYVYWGMDAGEVSEIGQKARAAREQDFNRVSDFLQGQRGKEPFRMNVIPEGVPAMSAPIR